MLRYPEACLITGTWLLVSAHTIAGWVFIATSFLLALARTSLEFHRLNLERQEKEDMIKASSELIGGLTDRFGIMFSGMNRNDNVH